MHRLLIFPLFALFMVSCGSQPESDQVGIQPRNMQYVFARNPAFTKDTAHAGFEAVLYLYSGLVGLTQFTLNLKGTHTGISYRAGLYEEDSNGIDFLAPVPKVALGDVQAMDTLSAMSLAPVEWHFDSITQQFKGYLVVYALPAGDTLRDSMLIIKGRIGQP